VYTYTYTPDNTEQYFKIGYKRTTKAATQNVLVLRGANVNTGVSHISADNNITEAGPDECTQELIDIFFSSVVLVFKR